MSALELQIAIPHFSFVDVHMHLDQMKRKGILLDVDNGLIPYTNVPFLKMAMTNFVYSTLR